MKGRFGDKQRIEHALDAIAEIESYLIDQTLSHFLENSMMRFPCVKQLEIIGVVQTDIPILKSQLSSVIL